MSEPQPDVTFPRWQIRHREGVLIFDEWAWMDGGGEAEPDWDCVALDEQEDRDRYIAVQVDMIDYRLPPKADQ